MTRNVLQFVALFFIMVLAQAICSKICLFNIAVPIIFIYFLVRLPISIGVNWMMTIAFLLGLTIDVFNNTQGMNALSCVILAILRRPIFRLYSPREDDLTDTIPSINSLGLSVFFRYMSTLTVIYCTLLFSIQAFSIMNISLTLQRIVASSILSIILILGFDSLAVSHREKRL
ncbi:MAG: rod shape-determining protein MreD [Muribaculaceae bacterium]